MPNKTLRMLLASGALVIGVAGCGDDAEQSSADTTTSTTAAEAPADTPDEVAGDEVPEPGPGEGDQVWVDTFIYRPDPLTTAAGTKVTWTQLDDIEHTVTSGDREGGPDGMFDASLEQGDEFSFTFDEPGTYAYYCTRHNGEGMTGEVVVE